MCVGMRAGMVLEGPRKTRGGLIAHTYKCMCYVRRYVPPRVFRGPSSTSSAFGGICHRCSRACRPCRISFCRTPAKYMPTHMSTHMPEGRRPSTCFVVLRPVEASNSISTLKGTKRVKPRAQQSLDIGGGRGDFGAWRI